MTEKRMTAEKKMTAPLDDDDLFSRAWRNQTKGDVVKILKLEERGAVDYALPQDWVDDFKKVTGTYPVSCFVWFYPRTGEGTIFGRPYPLTDAARHLLTIYNSRKGTDYPIY